MVKRCIVGGCSNTTREGVSLHSFPTNSVSRKQWIKQIRTTRKDWTEPTSDRRDSQVVCSEHFREEDFDPAYKIKESFGIKTIRRLLPNAVPSVFSHQITHSTCTPNKQKSRVTAGLTKRSPRGAFQKRERARVLKEIFQNQHPEDNVQERTQKTPITQSTVDGVTYPGVHIDVTENFPCISSVHMTMTTFEFSSAIDLDGLITSVLNELCDTQANEEARAYDSNIDQLALQVKTTERKVQSINRSYADCMSQLDSYKETLEDEQRDDEIKLKEAEEAAAVAAAQPEIIEDDSDDDDDVQFIQKTFDPDMAAKRQTEVSSTPVLQIQIVQKPAATVQQTFQPILPKGGLPQKQTEHASSPTLATLRAALKASINKQLNQEAPREEPAPPPPPPPPPPQVIVVSPPATTETTRILPVTTQPVVTTATTSSTINSFSQTQVRTASSFVTQNSQATEKAFAEEINNVNAGTKVLVRKTGDIWYPGVIVEVQNVKQPIAERRYRVKFEASKGQKLVNGKQLAFAQSITRPVSVGSRVTALYKDEETKNSHYAGIVAESPNGRNQLRYLIFFDDGYAQYCSSKEIFKVFEQSENVWEDVHPDSKEFIKEYLAQYPERPMVRLHKGQSVKTEWKGTWWNARVEEVDASLVLMYFAADKRHEWIYRGSTRLEPLFTALANAEANRLAGRGKRHNLTMAGSKKPVVEYTRQNTSDTQTGNSDEKSSRNKEDVAAQPPSSTSIEKKGLTKSASDPLMETKKRPVARKSTTGKMPSNTEEKPKWEPPWIKMQRKTALQVLQSREAEVQQQQQNRETESEEKYQASSISSNKTGTDMASVLQERLTQAVADDEMMEKESFGERMDKVISVKSKDSKSFKPHLCGPHCLGDDGDDPDKHNGCNPLLIPLFCGWERHVCKLRPGGKRVVMYRAPCSRRLRSMEEVDLYLQKTDSQLTINLFCYDPELHVHAEFVPVKTFCDIKDLSYGKENMSISCVNGIDRQYPEYVDYSNQRIPANGVKLNVDPDFLVCCSCTDGCRDKSKCECQQLTIESTAVIPPFKENPDAGYINMRLKEPLLTGIYECNSRCKCGPKCVNRVVQHGLRNRLQVYKTEKRGWGLRCLDDIPAGGFICIYAGQLLTDQGANEDGQQYGDEYLAELDYIEVVERHKEGYESDVDDDDTLDKDDDEEESDDEDRGSSNSDCSFEGGKFDGVADKRHDTRKRTSDDREIGKLVLRRDSSRSGDGDHYEWSVRIKDRKEKNGEEEQEVQVISDNAEKNLSGTEAMDVDELPDLEPPDHSNKLSVKEEEEEDVEEMEVLEHSHSQKRLGRSTASRFGNLIPPKLKKEDSDKDRDKGEKRLSTRYFFKDSQQCYIMDAKSMGNIGRYLNHSCSPNAFVQNVFVDTHDLRFPWVAFFAGQFIRAGSELTWDYNYEVGSVPGKVLYCYCGSADCRGRLL